MEDFESSKKCYQGQNLYFTDHWKEYNEFSAAFVICNNKKKIALDMLKNDLYNTFLAEF